MRFHFILILLLLAFIANSQEVVIVSNPNEVVSLAEKTLFVEDADGVFSFTDLVTKQTATTFRPVHKPVINFGITPRVYWLRVTLINRTGKELLLRIGNSAITDIQVFETVNNRVVRQHHGGNWQAFDKKELKDEEYFFSLATPPNTNLTLFIRVQHFRGTQFQLQAGTLQAFYTQGSKSDLMDGIYFGFMILMILYNLFIFFSLKDLSYLYYVGYIFLMGLLNASINGYAFRFFWPHLPQMNQYEDIIASLVGIGGILFATKFLNTRNNVPLYHKIFIGLLAGYGIVILFCVLGLFYLGSVSVGIVSIAVTVIFFLATYKIVKIGYRPAKFFLIAWTLLLVCVVIFVLKDYGVLPYNSFTSHTLQIGSAVEALLLSIALADRINIYKKEKEQAQSETLHSLEENRKLITEQNIVLEKKVEERTLELKQTNKDLLNALMNLKDTQNQLVQKEKMASLGELTAGVAHEIQNPLNFVNNFCEVNNEMIDEMRKELDKGMIEEAKNIATTIKDNHAKINYHGKRADAIVKGMLQHSRKSSGLKESTDINALADEYLRLSYHGLRAKDKSFNANFTVNFDESIGKIDIVPQDIGRVLLNLYNNAFYSVNEKKKLTGTFEPLVHVSTKQSGDSVVVTVRDNGVGISQKVIDKIYQPFFTTKPTGEGTGLGLSMSYDIVTKGHGQ